MSPRRLDGTESDANARDPAVRTAGAAPPTLPQERIVVAAAVIERHDAFLLTRRLAGTHLEGHWEFPGGKCEPGEALAACLLRELDEELGCRARVHECLLSTTHAYHTRIVDLHFYRCELLSEPHPRLGQQMRWVPRGELRMLPLPPADAALIDILHG